MQGLRRIALTVAAIVLTAATTAATAQDDAETVAKTRSVIRLGAAEALESWVVGGSFNRAEIARLVEIISSDPVTHQSTNPDLVRAALRSDFLRRFDAQVAEVAKIDKDKKYGLAEWLAKNFARVPGPDGSPSPFDRAVASHESYLRGNELAQLYTEARKRVADTQFAFVRKALRPDKSFPTEEDIEHVYLGKKDRAALIADLKRSLSARQRLLLEAEILVSGLAAEMVSDGLNQLTAQLHALDDEPTAHTPQGIQRELTSRQAGLVNALKPAPTRKVYPVFPLAAKTAEQRTLERWDAHVAEAITAVGSQFERGERRLPADLEARMEKAICANPDAHDTPYASERAFKPLTLEIVRASRTWVADTLRRAAAKTPSKFDQPDELAGLLGALEPRLETDAAPRERWQTLSYDVRRAVERTTETVRQRIAKVQAARACPDLMKGAWIPDEKVLLAHDPSRLVRRDLATLSIWQAGKPPEESAMLSETWDLWLESAQTALEQGHVAINSQRRLIDEQKPEILGLIKKDPAPGASHWIEVYASMVTRQWSPAPAAAVSRYPGLFKVTRTEIEGIVVSALDLVVKDAQAVLVQNLFPPVEQEIVNLARAGKVPVFDPHYQAFRATVEREWAKHKLAVLHAELFSATDDAIRSRVQQSVDAQVARLKQIENGLGPLLGQFSAAATGVQDPEKQQERWARDLAAVLGGYEVPETMRDNVVRIDKWVRVQVAQNLLVDHYKPEIEKNIAHETRQGRIVDSGVCEKELRSYVERAWAKAELHAAHPQLFDQVQQRITGIVAKLTTAQKVELENLVFEHQSKHVTENEAAIRRRVRVGEFSTQSTALEGCYALVRKSWENSNDPLQASAPDLLDATRSLIQSKVVEFFTLGITPPRLGPSNATDNAKNLSDGAADKQTAPGNRLTVAAEPVRNADGLPDSKNLKPSGVVIPSAFGREEGPSRGLDSPSEKLPFGSWVFWLLLLLPMVGLALWLWLWRRRGNRGVAFGKGSADWQVLAARYLHLYHSFVQLYLEQSEVILIGYIEKKGPPHKTDLDLE
jgi:hypothetical protein